jgi:hypothetical membrane protein
MAAGWTTTQRALRKIGGWSLLIGSVQFVALMAVEELLIPGFSPLTNTISDLGSDRITSYDWMFNGSVIAIGLFTLLGVGGVHAVLRRSERSPVGAYLLALSGIGAIGVGLFPETHPGPYHTIFAFLAFAMANTALIVLGGSFSGDREWGSYALYSGGSGIVGWVALLLFAIGRYGPLDQGGMERLIVVPVLLWAIIVGARMARPAPRPPPAVWPGPAPPEGPESG